MHFLVLLESSAGNPQITKALSSGGDVNLLYREAKALVCGPNDNTFTNSNLRRVKAVYKIYSDIFMSRIYTIRMPGGAVPHAPFFNEKRRGRGSNRPNDLEIRLKNKGNKSARNVK